MKTPLLLFALVALSLVPALADNGLLEIHSIDVGQGNCTLVSCPDGETVLIDCGSSGGGTAVQARQYFQKVPRTQSVDIDTLVVTHPDKDHYNLLPDVVGNGNAGQVLRIGSKSDYKMVSARNWLYGHNDSSGSLAAEEEEKSRAQKWREPYFGVRVGYLEVEDVDEGDLTFGVMAGARFDRHLGLAFALDHHDSEFNLENRATFALTLGLEVHFLKPKVTLQPYGIAGVGYYRARVERVDEFGDIVIDDVDSKVGFHYGAGLDVAIKHRPGGNGRLALNLETRKIFTDPEDSGETKPDGFQYTVGLKFKLPH